MNMLELQSFTISGKFMEYCSLIEVCVVGGVKYLRYFFSYFLIIFRLLENIIECYLSFFCESFFIAFFVMCLDAGTLLVMVIILFYHYFLCSSVRSIVSVYCARRELKIVCGFFASIFVNFTFF